MKKMFLIFIALFSLTALAGFQIELNNQNALERHSYYFGNVNVNFKSNVRYKVTNTGTTPLVFQRATISGASFDAYHNCIMGLKPKEVCYFTIEFWPAFESLYYGRFDLQFDQGSEIMVDVTGRGVR